MFEVYGDEVLLNKRTVARLTFMLPSEKARVIEALTSEPEAKRFTCQECYEHFDE